MQKRTQFYTLILLLTLGVAFWLRWRFIQTINLYPDEFVTLLAMDMIRQKGAPILPSGLFYDHGLLYSYAAALISFLGDAVLWGRLTSLFFGLTTIALVYRFGQRWFTPAVGLLAALGLALAPSAIQWSSRVRMYALLQLLVLTTIYLTIEGVFNRRAKASWGAVLTYFGALLTQFASVTLFIPLIAAEFMASKFVEQWEKSRPEKNIHLSQFHKLANLIWLRRLLMGAAVLVAFLVKRAGQPKGIEPIRVSNLLGGVWQVLEIYGHLSFDLGKSWADIAPFFLEPPLLVYSLSALIISSLLLMSTLLIVLLFPKTQAPVMLTGTLGIILGGVIFEMLFLLAPDRRDEKYLFMMLPVLLLLGAYGIVTVFEWPDDRMYTSRELLHKEWQTRTLTILTALALGFYARNAIVDLFNDVGENYEAAFAYVAENWRPGDAVLTGTPAAAYHYLGHNDFYAVQSGGSYDYRILTAPNGQPVERWLASPWINTVEGLNAVLTNQPVWLVLERWGLLIQYYEPLFMQNILAQTEFIREDNGVIVLKSLPEARALQEAPAVPADAILDGVEGDPGQLKLLGYTLEDERLTLYWQAQRPVNFDYTVFVNAQNSAGETAVQFDHRPLGSVYPTTLWPLGEVIRETSQLKLPPGKYHLRVGMYRLETGERLWVPGDEAMQNMVYLGEIVVE